MLAINIDFNINDLSQIENIKYAHTFKRKYGEIHLSIDDIDLVLAKHSKGEILFHFNVDNRSNSIVASD